MPTHPRAAIRRLLVAEEGATAIEYAILASGVAVAIAAVITTLGGQVNALYTAVSNMFS
jgi:pilus assembly protein Flp/PilA